MDGPLTSLGPAAPLVAIAATLGVVLLLMRLRTGVGLALLGGTATLGLSFGLPLQRWPLVALHGLSNPKTLFLSAIVTLILVLSRLLQSSGQAARLVSALSGYLRAPALRLVFFPALVGLLPMPGGAVFSAPMVAEVSEHMRLAPLDRALINYWFRHIWELVWPLYPGLLLAASLSGLSVPRVALYGLPALLLAVGLGWVFIVRPALRGDDATADEPDREPAQRLRTVLREGLPLLVAIVGAVGLQTALSVLHPGWPSELGVLAGLLGAIGCALVQGPAAIGPLADTLRSRALYSMLLVVVAIYLFQEMLLAVGAVEQLARIGATGELALLIAAGVLPLLVGVVAGINVAFVGATVPLLMGLLRTQGLADEPAPYLVLAMFSGYAGILASPIHVCFVLTCEFFGVPVPAAWRRVALPSLLILAAGLAYYVILREFGA